jgi:hypothetical protein
MGRSRSCGGGRIFALLNGLVIDGRVVVEEVVTTICFSGQHLVHIIYLHMLRNFLIAMFVTSILLLEACWQVIQDLRA